MTFIDDDLTTAINGLGGMRRQPWQYLAAELRRTGNEDGLRIVAELVDQVHSILDQRHRAVADRDRGIRSALARAEDCSKHGDDLRYERHQAYWFSRLADDLNEERVAYLTALDNIRDAFVADDKLPLRGKVLEFIGKTKRSARKIRARKGAPALADCQRAGHCEHPQTRPHWACDQLTLLGEGTEHWADALAPIAAAVTGAGE